EALLKAVPNVQLSDQKLKYIAGSPPDLLNPPAGCRFNPRCPYVMDACKKREPQPNEVKPGRIVRCFKYHD
ncbi:MAG: oligopeptide/dipeptide ABC transporter ATP-binding protein, partial [Candidatus Bathyarchaeia archaeon]